MHAWIVLLHAAPRKGSDFLARKFAMLHCNKMNKFTFMAKITPLKPQMLEGVVTFMSQVEVFASRIKIESSDQSLFGGPIKETR